MQRNRVTEPTDAPSVSADGRWIQDVNGWTEEPPKENGTYWHWNGCQSCAPVPMFVSGQGGMSGKCFITMGQLGITEAIDCDEWGGWWMKLETPAIPLMEHHHCHLCDM